MNKFVLFLKQWWKWVALAAIILLAWLGLRACSSSDTYKKELYVICRSTTWESLQLMGKERNLQAFVNELLDTVAKKSGLRLAWMETNTSTLFERLDNGICDAVISTLQPNVVNKEQYYFSKPFFALGPVLIVRTDSKATSLKDMEGKTVGIHSGTSLNFNSTPSGKVDINNITINAFENMNRALEALFRDQIDGIIMNNLTAYYHIEGFYAGKLKIITAPITDEGFRLIALKNPFSEKLISTFDETLSELKEDGDYTAMLAKWNLIDPETRFRKDTAK